MNICPGGCAQGWIHTSIFLMYGQLQQYIGHVKSTDIKWLKYFNTMQTTPERKSTVTTPYVHLKKKLYIFV